MTMKKISIYIAIILISTAHAVLACNVCGSASGASYNGILPQYRKNILALRHRYRSFDQYELQNDNTKLKSSYQYQSVDLWGRIYLKKRVQFFFTVPYTVNTLASEQSETSTLKGIGDITLQVNYNLVNTSLDTSSTHTIQHNVLIGGGVKLPTGKYQQRNRDDLMFAPNFQAGTGAYSYTTSLIYTLRYRKVGFNADVNYIYNEANELAYAFGNQFTSSLTLFAWLKKGSTTFLPNTGVFYERMDRDINNGYYNKLSGGYALNYNAGMDVYFKKIFVGATFQTPLLQQIGSDDVVYKLRYMLNVGFMF